MDIVDTVSVNNYGYTTFKQSRLTQSHCRPTKRRAYSCELPRHPAILSSSMVITLPLGECIPWNSQEPRGMSLLLVLNGFLGNDML